MFSNTFINSILPSVIGIVPLIILTLFIIHIKKKSALRRKNPINIYLLRGPGQSLVEQLDEISLDISAYLMITPFISLTFYAAYLNSKRSITLIFLMVISIVFGMAFIFYKTIKLVKAKEKLQLGYDAELAVGQELNQLMRLGFYVFHDVNLKTTVNEFNIDHIVVGKSGVFTVETKGRSKPAELTGRDSAKVIFDGQKLIFPTWEETEPIDQAKRQTQALQKWLSGAIGEPVTAKAIIALPGWYTKTNQKSLITVINGKNPEKAFLKNGEEILTEKQINQIVHQLDCLCRNVGPRAFSLPK